MFQKPVASWANAARFAGEGPGVTDQKRAGTAVPPGGKPGGEMERTQARRRLHERTELGRPGESRLTVVRLGRQKRTADRGRDLRGPVELEAGVVHVVHSEAVICDGQRVSASGEREKTS